MEVVTGLGQKRYGDPTNRMNQHSELKSSQIADRIARIKHKLDQLTDNESWLITRIENVFLNASR